MKAKGYDIAGLAKQLTCSRVAIEKDLHKTEVTRRALVKYVPTLLHSVDDFFCDETKMPTQVETSGGTVPVAMYAELQAKHIATLEKAGAEKDRYIGLLEQHLELTRRFFPNAAQQAALAVLS